MGWWWWGWWWPSGGNGLRRKRDRDGEPECSGNGGRGGWSAVGLLELFAAAPAEEEEWCTSGAGAGAVGWPPGTPAMCNDDGPTV